MADKVTLKLAHPLSPQSATRLRLESKEYALGEQVELLPDDARALINAGYAQVDPEDRRAVARALGGESATEAEPRTAGGGVGGATGEQQPKSGSKSSG